MADERDSAAVARLTRIDGHCKPVHGPASHVRDTNHASPMQPYLMLRTLVRPALPRCFGESSCYQYVLFVRLPSADGPARDPGSIGPRTYVPCADIAVAAARADTPHARVSDENEETGYQHLILTARSAQATCRSNENESRRPRPGPRRPGSFPRRTRTAITQQPDTDCYLLDDRS